MLTETPVRNEPVETQEEIKEEMEEGRTWIEEIEVAGHQLVERIKEVVAEGNVRRLILSTSDGAKLLEIPLTAGVVVGGVVTLVAPLLAALGAFAALLARVKVQVVRVEEQNDDTE
jgi:hypothetical protein